MRKKYSCPLRQVHYAWRILAACCAVQFAGCGIYSNSIGIFIPATCADMGFSTAEYTFSLTVSSLANMAGLPLAGRWISKYKPRVFLSLCMVMCALSLAVSACFTELWQWYVGGIIRGFFGSFLFMVMSPIMINRWFEEKAAFAVGLAMAFSGIGGAVMAPLGNWLIESLGWRMASVGIAGLSLILTVPFTAFVLRSGPEELGLRPYGADCEKSSEKEPETAIVDKGRLLHSALFLKMIFGTALISFPIVFNSHFLQFSVSLELSTTIGAFMGSCCMAGNIFGKLLLGWLSDKISISRGVTVGAVSALCGMGLLLLSGGDRKLLYMGALLFGTCMSLTAVAVPMLVQDFYSGEEYKIIFPFCSMATSAISAFGTGGVGYLYDITGSYRLFIIMCMIGYGALPVYIFIMYRQKREGAGKAAARTARG